MLCGTLWHEECRQACYPADAAALPDNFASALAYIRAYEPLLFSEAQAGLLQAPAEQHPVDIYRWCHTRATALQLLPVDAWVTQ